jgi:glycerol uptake facilitator protein
MAIWSSVTTLHTIIITTLQDSIMSQTSTLKGQCIAEFLGTGLLIFFGVGCVAALKVAGASFGQWEISIIWGLGVAMAIYLTAGVSGAHLNPAVTIALWLFACFDGRKVVPFIISQFAGAFCAAALVYGLYYNLFLDYETTHHMVRGSVKASIWPASSPPIRTRISILCRPSR